MRWLRDCVAVVGLAALSAGTLYVYRQQETQVEAVQDVAQAVQSINQQIALQATTHTTALNERGWPRTIDPKWFDSPPMNDLVGDDHPWIEIAGPEDAALQHPRVRIAVSDQLAAFWYNPYQGVVRARVPVMLSDEDATRVYNQVNSCNLSTIFWKEPEPAREAPAPAGNAVAAASDSAADDARESAAQLETRPRMSVTVTRTSRSAKSHRRR